MKDVYSSNQRQIRKNITDQVYLRLFKYFKVFTTHVNDLSHTNNKLTSTKLSETMPLSNNENKYNDI